MPATHHSSPPPNSSKSTTHPVGQKEPNAFGLYDMHGSIWQWCQDWWEDDYSQSSSENPQGPTHGVDRVERGGCWGNDPLLCRSAYRSKCNPDGHAATIGFRVVVALASRTQ